MAAFIVSKKQEAGWLRLPTLSTENYLELRSAR